MAEKTFLVLLKHANPGLVRLVASKVELYDEHLVFVDSDGKLVALILIDLVLSWNALSG
jgi:hypothetical protein